MAIRKVTVRKIKENINSKGYVKIGSLYYRLIQVNSDTVKESDSLLAQLESEGKLNYYIVVPTRTPKAKINKEILPVYGNPDKYVTRWFCETQESAIKSLIKELSENNLIRKEY